MSKKRVLLSCLASVALAGGASVAMSQISANAADCYGLDALRVCHEPNPSFYPSVDPTGNEFEECVHTGSTCHPVYQQYPSVSPGTGGPGEFRCYMGNEICLDPR